MKRINFILVFLAILGFIFAFFLFSKEGYAININEENKEIVEKALSDEIENIDKITNIIMGQGWQSGKLTIYYSLGKTETLHMTEGMFHLSELEEYIKENGYNLDNIGRIFIVASSLMVVYLVAYKFMNKKENKDQ